MDVNEGASSKLQLSSQYRIRVMLTSLLVCVISGCNLQQGPVVPTPTLIPTPTAFEAPADQPTRTPISPVAPTVVDLAPPPVTNLVTPTAFPLGVTSAAVTPGSGTIIPTVSTLEAVKSTTIQADAGRTVGLNYTVTMTTGSLTLTLQGPGGAIWQKTFTTAETGRAEITIPQTGAYDVMAHTDRFDGTYTLSWD